MARERTREHDKFIGYGPTAALMHFVMYGKLAIPGAYLDRLYRKYVPIEERASCRTSPHFAWLEQHHLTVLINYLDRYAHPLARDLKIGVPPAPIKPKFSREVYYTIHAQLTPTQQGVYTQGRHRLLHNALLPYPYDPPHHSRR